MRFGLVSFQGGFSPFSRSFCRQILVVGLALFVIADVVCAQDRLPPDNGLATYHTAPRYRDSESHPLRILGYILHPIGWVAREVIFRPLSYFASSSETRKSVMGYREPYDYRQPECFSADDSVPDCRSTAPFNYDVVPIEEPQVVALEEIVEPVRQVYFPDVNFQFNKADLTDLGKGRTFQIAQLLEREPGLRIVLEGHADYIGNNEYNETLGMSRAQMVRNELVSNGISSERLSTVTFGKTQPALDQKTDWARAVNRRVEVHAEAAQVALPAE